jgi:hypothetical protein
VRGITYFGHSLKVAMLIVILPSQNTAPYPSFAKSHVLAFVQHRRTCGIFNPRFVRLLRIVKYLAVPEAL